MFYIKGEFSMSKQKVIKENEKSPKGNGPGSGNHGTKKSVANKVPRSWWIGKGRKKAEQ